MDSVEIRELAVGSWVYDGTEKARVTGFTCDGIVETTYRRDSNVEFLSPIPVTCGFFGENGFVWMEENQSYVLSSERWRAAAYLHAFRDDGTIESCDLWCGNPMRFCQIRLRYVHELQAAFALCGVDADVKA